MSGALVLERVRKTFNSHVAVEELTLEVGKDEFISLLGPSGCGKTTTLRMAAGFIEPTAGRILLRDKDITNEPPERRKMGLVFQSYALFPHMTVRKNIAFGLACHKVPKVEATRRIDNVLELTGLQPYAERYPRQLSGGQQQRVAVARVLALEPEALLFDEPLSNLDARLRLQMRGDIRNLQRSVGVPALFVTHDQEEAIAISDRVVVLNAGKVEQIGTPIEIYDNPKSEFVAEFIGTSNMLKGAIVGDRCSTFFETKKGLKFGIDPTAASGSGTVAIRPERVDFVDVGGYLAEVEEVLHLGALAEYRLRLESGDSIRVHRHRRAGTQAKAVGETVRVNWRPEDAVLVGGRLFRSASIPK
jgi:putative spermidine/putrescine transport system ATP-binding protein